MQHSFSKVFLKFQQIFPKHFFKNLVKISIKLDLRIAQILQFTQNFFLFLEFPQISNKILSHQHFHNLPIWTRCDNRSLVYDLPGSCTSRRDRVSRIKLITTIVMFFERNIEKVFFYNKVFAIIMQKFYRFQIAQRSSRVQPALWVHTTTYYTVLF